MNSNNQIVMDESSWFCSMTAIPPFSIHSMVYDWLISHNFQFFSFCNRKSNSVDETGLETTSSATGPNHLTILLCLVLCLCLVSVLDKIKSFLKSIPNREMDNDNQTITTTQSSNTFIQKIVNYSMVLIHERRIGLIITTIGLFVFAFFVLSHKTDEQVILLIKSNKKQFTIVTLNQTLSENSTISTPPSISQNNTSNNLLETHSNQTNQISTSLRENSVNNNVQNTSPSRIIKNQQLYISLIKSTWIEMQLQNQLKVGTVTMTPSQQDTFLESAFKAILNIALLALKFFYIYLAMIGLILLLRWLTLGSLSGISAHPIGMAPPLPPTIPNASLQFNFASP
ncbi:hypothetical protein NAEGRDRAFT_78938 [Naegleria gruberi]|uniref:Uncharacterized protein n=1 Tax=Naegleria gruberi TaxID=5762 RepID=D2V7U5_NAEGR|nr:uncharacterized protein NAEGRDRAFT_78938 [Naegleria gruberi]EFC47063.1 hypothetical protein NAEGRDRAFT_78938 [Naegleria gruberi]|eukprot:XP_002679807.1 hypothetical protein NAEGRDRAFT_78938 [Naegleria gruberi strain NEG-M]